MATALPCDYCSTPLSYGEAFRHRLAAEVAVASPASRAILGDRAYPRQPRAACSCCRQKVEPAALRRREITARNQRQLNSLLAGLAALLLIGLVTG